MHDDMKDRCELQDYNSQILPVHAALLHTGKVLYFSGSSNDPAKVDRPMETRTWDPADGTIRRVEPHGTQRDLFCTGHCFLPDGRLLVAGGTAGYSRMEAVPIFSGIRDAFVFDPFPEPGRWLRTGDMRAGRWYPTCVGLPSGDALVFSGVWDLGRLLLFFLRSQNNWIVERWSRDGGPSPTDTTTPGSWTDLRANRAMYYYPRVHLMPTGELIRVGQQRETLALDPATGRWRDLPPQPRGRYEGTSVLLPLRPAEGYSARILAVGGSPGYRRNLQATNSAAILDRRSGEWAWRWVPPMTFRRRHANSTLLLDGRVLVTAGGQWDREQPILETELFDPRRDKETWTLGDTCQVPRTYHSVAVLLPDGRVWTGGSNLRWGVEELRIELYTPGYCEEDDRPVIESSPPATRYGATFDLRVNCPTPVLEAAFVRPASVTHSFNVDQRWIGLEIVEAKKKDLTLRAPPRAEIAPPGWYLLTVLDEHRCPAPAQWIHLVPA